MLYRSREHPSWVWLGLISLLGISPCPANHVTVLRAARAEQPPAPLDLTPREVQILARRRAAHVADLQGSKGPRETENLTLDDSTVGLPWSLDSAADSPPLLAIDGDGDTAWRGAPDKTLWVYNLPLQRAVHLSLIRSYFGDSSKSGVPSVYHWEYRPAQNGACRADANWQLVSGSAVDDRDPNQFVSGPKDIHVRRQALFTDADACALRLVVTTSEGGPPVVRDLRVLEGARSLTRDPGVRVLAETRIPVVARSSLRGAVDGKYETLWAGRAGQERWTLRIELPEVRMIDRISLTLGLDAVTVPTGTGTGRRFSGAYLPLRYSLSASPDEDLAHLSPIEEAEPPSENGEPLPTRRRLVRLRAARPVRELELTITKATGPSGEDDDSLAAPVIRDLGVYEASDEHPVVTEPLFLSVNANPSAMTHEMKWGEDGADAEFARAIYHRLRRVISGFDVDTGYPADASRKRDLGRGKFLESIEGDDPLLAEPLLHSISPPPMVMLSGSLLFEFDEKTKKPEMNTQPWGWNVFASASDDDRGMGQLVPALRDRVAPFIGFCGGAHILGLFEAKSRGSSRGERAPGEGATRVTSEGAPGEGAPSEVRTLIDTVLVRNFNQEIRPLAINKQLYERAWWYDPPRTDTVRPRVTFEPSDPLFATLPEWDSGRATSLELPLSHIDMIRADAFDQSLSKFHVSAYSEYCRPWVSTQGPSRSAKIPREPSRGACEFPKRFTRQTPARTR